VASAWAIWCQLWPLAGIVDELGEAALGLVDEAGDQGDGGEVIAEPGAAALSERGQGVVDEIEGVVAAVRSWAGGHAQGAGV